MSALGTILVLDAAPPPPPKMADAGLRLDPGVRNVATAAQRLVVNCGGPGPLPTDLSDELVEALRTTAAHSTLVLADTNSTNILADGSLGKGVEDVTIDRSEDNDASRLEASHDGYVRALRPDPQAQPDARQRRQGIARRRPADRPRAARRSANPLPYAVRFHLAPGVEATVTADGMGAILRSQGRAAVELPLPRRRC